MSDMKQLIDQYVIENQQLRQQTEALLMLLRDVTFMYKDDKGKVRLSAQDRKKAENYSFEVKQLKASVILMVKEKPKE